MANVTTVILLVIIIGLSIYLYQRSQSNEPPTFNEDVVKEHFRIMNSPPRLFAPPHKSSYLSPIDVDLILSQQQLVKKKSGRVSKATPVVKCEKQGDSMVCKIQHESSAPSTISGCFRSCSSASSSSSSDGSSEFSPCLSLSSLSEKSGGSEGYDWENQFGKPLIDADTKSKIVSKMHRQNQKSINQIAKYQTDRSSQIKLDIHDQPVPKTAKGSVRDVYDKATQGPVDTRDQRIRRKIPGLIEYVEESEMNGAELMGSTLHGWDNGDCGYTMAEFTNAF